ncbi:2'-5' RNA ligase [Terribacillus aidingensis]|uniref:Putative phosphoesterase SAMN05421503_2290 n=1 Tax=Terribacillus aidingensis TaxID=586416 RepID=A0A285NXN9_9BACI|nr:2'-5' RNA ligase family protein [Terribacillus aidingensis]SNZ14250.1 2'-5' RNA ligase [Terribacillus aidingensis]
MNYTIAFFPSEHVQQEANSYRKRFDAAYALIKPHVKIRQPFTLNENELIDAVSELKRIARDTAPFSYTIEKVSTFAPAHNTLYFKVSPTEDLVNLHERLYQGFFDGEKKYNFVPHITIAQELSNGEYADLHGTLKLKTFQFHEEVTQFHLLEQQTDGKWTVKESFTLGEE